MNLLEAQTLINLFYSIFLICASVGGFFAFKRGKRVDTAVMQNDAIIALEAQIRAVKDELVGLREENARLKQTIDTIKIALLRKGWHVTIEGETIIVSDKQSEDVVTPLPKTRKKVTEGTNNA